MRETKAEIMAGVNDCVKSRILENNTVEYTREDGTKVIRLHHTDVLEFPPSGGVVFNSGGWMTVTTKERMNKHQHEATIIQERGLWYVCTGSHPYGADKKNRTPYYDGMKVKSGKVVRPRKNAHTRDEKILKQITAYCKALRSLDKLPEPDGGDCFLCRMDGGDTGHLQSHLDEMYIHGTLIYNALKWARYPNDLVFRMDVRTSIVSAVRRYFKSQLGLAV